ncbi:MAG: hypothetical protein AAF236_12355 [Verrucomicrobiota bacterium]
MKNEISLLTQFLENLEPEVAGRSGHPVTDDQRALITKFASGDLDAESRDALLPELLENEQAIRELVTQLESRS